MPRIIPKAALALATTAILLLNGSMASATMPAPARCGNAQSVCVISLRMMAPPPPRPSDLLAQQHAAALIAASVVLRPR